MMKKLLASLLVLPVMMLTACSSEQTSGNTSAVNTAAAAQQTQAAQQAPEKEVEHMTIQAEGKTFTAEIERNALTESFLTKLPRTLDMTPLGGDLIYGDSPISMPDNLVRDLKKGDLAYCQYGYFIIFTEDQRPDHTTGFIKVGRITSDNLDDLSALKQGAPVHFTL